MFVRSPVRWCVVGVVRGSVHQQSDQPIEQGEPEEMQQPGLEAEEAVEQDEESSSS